MFVFVVRTELTSSQFFCLQGGGFLLKSEVEICNGGDALCVVVQGVQSHLYKSIATITGGVEELLHIGELEEYSVVSILETTASDGKVYKTKFYNLDAIIAVGYRVNSQRATQFRMWATQVLREYIKVQPIESDFDKVVKRLRE